MGRTLFTLFMAFWFSVMRLLNALLYVFVGVIHVIIWILRAGEAIFRKTAIYSKKWSIAERIDSGNNLATYSCQLAFDAEGNALAVSNEKCRVWVRRYSKGLGWSKAEVIDSSKPEALDDNNCNAKSKPEIHIDGQGNAFAVWKEETGYDDTIGYVSETWINRFTAGSSWGQAERFDHTPGDAMPAQIVGDIHGNAFAVWAHAENNNCAIWVKKYTQEGWGEAACIAQNTGYFRILRVISDSNGNALVLWKQEKNNRSITGPYHIFVCYHAADSGWGKAILIQKDIDSVYIDTLAVAFDTLGNVMVVWSRNEGTVADSRVYIWARRYSQGTGWEKAVKIDPGATSRHSEHVSDSVDPKVTFDHRGDAIVVWTQRKEEIHGRIWTNRHSPGKGWGTAAPVSTQFHGESSPQMAIDQSGNILVVWRQRYGIGCSRYTADAGWSRSESIYSYNSKGNGLSNPLIAIGTCGNAIAIWQRQFFFCSTIWSKQYIAGKGWRRTKAIKRDYTSSATMPRIAIDSCGTAHVIWEQRHGEDSNAQFWASYFTSAC